MNIYLLKDLAVLSGQSIYTIKYYLKLGMLKERGKTPASNFRYFDDSTLATLKKIRGLRLKKVSIKEIKSLLSWESAAP